MAQKTWEKIDTTEVLVVRSTGRRLYLTLSRELCEAYGIVMGDKLRVRIIEKQSWKEEKEE